jgi:Fe2+ or Zn2+ uptake regulation protein
VNTYYCPDPECAGELVNVEGHLRCGVCDVEVSALAWQFLSEIEMRSIVFLDAPLWQASAFHLVAGRKGVGKGTMLADLAARFTQGEFGDRCKVAWIGTEDSASIDVKPRVVASGGEADRIAIVTDWLQLPRDITALSYAVTAIGDVGLVIIDPIGNHIAGKSSNAETDIRDAIGQLNRFADEHECVVLGVRHLSEKEAKAGLIAAILGSSAWVQVPRVVIGIARDNEDPQVSHVQVVAGNRLPAGTPGRAFRIEGVHLDGLENEVTRAVWIGDSTKNIEDLIGESVRKEPSKSASARELILDLLEDAPDQTIESDELDARVAQETGLKAGTIRNLRTKLKDEGLVRPVPQKDARGAVERWFITRTEAARPPARGELDNPDHDSNLVVARFGSTTPHHQPVPTHPSMCSGYKKRTENEPDHDFGNTGTGSGSGHSFPARSSDSTAACVQCGGELDTVHPELCATCREAA